MESLTVEGGLGFASVHREPQRDGPGQRQQARSRRYNALRASSRAIRSGSAGWRTARRRADLTASADGTVRGFQSGDGAQRSSAAAGARSTRWHSAPTATGWPPPAKRNRCEFERRGSPAAKPQFAGFTAPVKGVAFSGDGLRVVGAVPTRRVLVFNVASGESVQGFAEQTGAVVGLASAGEKGDMVIVGCRRQNGARLAIGRREADSRTHSARHLVGYTTGRPNADRFGQRGRNGAGLEHRQRPTDPADEHAAPVTCVAVRPDGLRIASAGGGNLVRLWNAQNFQQVAEMKGDYRAAIPGRRGRTGRAALNALAAAETAAVAAEEAAGRPRPKT